MFWLKSYNDRQGRKQFNRSVESLKAEWYEHNFLYYILPGEQDKKDAMHADLDENGKGTYNNYLPFGWIYKWEEEIWYYHFLLGYFAFIQQL